MKKLCAVLLCALMAGSLCFAADLVEGHWISYDEKTGKATAGWEIVQKDGLLYGYIRSIAGFPQDALATSCKESYKGFPVSGIVNKLTTVGQPWIFGLKQDKPGMWSGGSIIDPDSGSMYKCKITFHEADGKKYPKACLEMRGEIGLGIGRSQFWFASSKEEANGLR